MKIHFFKQLISCFIFVLILSKAYSQNIQLGELTEKYWGISSYQAGGQRIPALESGNNDSSIFFSNHTGKSTNSGTFQWYNWQVDSVKNVLILTHEKSKEISEMRILLLNKNEFEFEITGRDSMKIKVLMLDLGKK